MEEEAIQLEKVKESLRNWKEILLPVSSVLLWEKQWYPAAIVGSTSMFFMSVWLLDPSLLTALSVIGLTVTVSDYIVPLLAASMLKIDVWTESDEVRFHEICSTIVRYYNIIADRTNSFYDLRSTKPRMYYGCTIILLLLLAWVGNNINNLFLTYLLVSLALLVPGMERTGAINTYSKYLVDKIAEVATNTKLYKVNPIKKD